MDDSLRAQLLLEGWEFKPIDNDDDVFTMEEWISMCQGGGFTDYDGMGNYAIYGEIVRPAFNYDDPKEPWIYPSDVKKGKIDMRFTHVVWYNR